LAVVEDREGTLWAAVARERATDTRRLGFRGQDDRARAWMTTLALDFVRRGLLAGE